MKIMKNKKGDLGYLVKRMLIPLAIFLVAVGLIWMLFGNVGRQAMDRINWNDDYDGDRIINLNDKCCSSACAVPGFNAIIETDCPDGAWCGCAEDQGKTNCTSSVCFLDYDRDNVANRYDACCPAQCKTDARVSLNNCDEKKTGDCGCAPGQIKLACDVDENQPCSPEQIQPLTP